jgi:hypothetical protein
LQGVARELLGLRHRITGCLRYRRFGVERVQVLNRASTGQAYYSGLQVCGVAAACPCCGARIAEARAVDLEMAIAAWKAGGGSVALVTLTLAHRAGQALAGNLAALLGAYRAMTQSRAYRRLKDRYGLAHFVRGLEITWSPVNGWHPHLHVLAFFSGVSVGSGFEAEFWALWAAQLVRVGRSCSRAHGIRVQRGFSKAQKYITKVGRLWGLADEVVRANSKRGRLAGLTPPDLLRAHRDQAGEAAPAIPAGALYVEYVEVMHGRHMLQWSAGLRAACGLAEERSDQEVADGVDQGDRVLLDLDRAEWSAVRRSGGILRLLEVADGGDDRAAAGFVAACVGRVVGERPWIERLVARAGAREAPDI